MSEERPMSHLEMDWSPRFPSWVSKAVLVVAIAVIVLGGVFGAGWFAHDQVSADGSKPSSDLVQRLDQNRLGIVVGTVDEKVCVTLLKSDFSPEATTSCVSTSGILNFTDYEYGPSVLPALGEMYDIHYIADRGVQEGVVFYRPGNGPKPSPTKITASSTPGVDVPTATPAK